MSAAFCGVEVLSREVRGGTVDKWNNMLGACRSLLPRRYTHTRTEHEQDHFACHLGVMPAPVQIGWVPDFGAGFLDGSAGCVGNLGKGPGMMASVSVSLRCTQPKRMQCRGGVRWGVYLSSPRASQKGVRTMLARACGHARRSTTTSTLTSMRFARAHACAGVYEFRSNFVRS